MADIEKKSEHHTCESRSGHYCSGSSFWGLLFLVFGGYFLLRALGFVSGDFPFWSLLAIFFGIYLIVRRRKRVC